MSHEYNYKHTYTSFIVATVLGVYFIVWKFWTHIILAFALFLCYKLFNKLINRKLPLEGKAVLITGCDTGSIK